ncbi:beta-glucuronidase [Streptococcus sp. S784/96/1]|uniref:beta-glucuronidase n=1 Tax=Streptococcus sp. S784/96/1 TaxID=2653499 RepID=UPI0013873A81|nr:beta-glucuronidase [Streptococcus sp. S784/96/1]
MLYPKNTATRQVISLDGYWKFKLDNEHGFEENWFQSPLVETIPMVVPGAFNDLAIDEKIRHHLGWVWYERDFSVSDDMLEEALYIRFGSVTHEARVYVNGQEVGGHKGGFTPFSLDISEVVKVGQNRLTVAVSNILDYTTLPVGIYEESKQENGSVKRKLIPNFDFFNYSGILRTVNLCVYPKEAIDDIILVTDFDGDIGFVDYEVKVTAGKVMVSVVDEDGVIVAEGTGQTGRLTISNVRLWEPLNAYLYQFEVTVRKANQVIDTYTESFGVRTVKVEGAKFLINNKPFYFKGFGKHEDNIGTGRGHDAAMDLLDANLIKWTGANSIRTAHYPHSEEFMQLADRMGIVVIDETPAVGLTVNFNAVQGQSKNPRDSFAELQTKEAHEQVLRELIARDKNHPCVVMWSIANEPGSDEESSKAYFEPLIQLTRSLDGQKLPVTIVLFMGATARTDHVAEMVDVICLNRYYGWYINLGNLDEAKMYLKMELGMWDKRCPNKPIMLTEYGADTVAGFHDVYTRAYTEEYQTDFYRITHEVVDQVPNFIGEQVWNFADFETSEGLIRVGGNKKGIFTRDRKPKAVAYHLKQRWEAIPEFGYKTHN